MLVSGEDGKTIGIKVYQSVERDMRCNSGKISEESSSCQVWITFRLEVVSRSGSVVTPHTVKMMPSELISSHKLEWTRARKVA
jgi:hypothetical protein